MANIKVYFLTISFQTMIGHLQKVDFHPLMAGHLLQTQMVTEVTEARVEVQVLVTHPRKKNPKRLPRSLKNLLNQQNAPMPIWDVAIAAMNPKGSQPTLFGKEMFKGVSQSSFPMNVLEKFCQLSLVPIATLLMF